MMKNNRQIDNIIMKRLLFLVTLVFLIVIPGYSQQSAKPKKLPDNQRMAWWRDAGFGMFIHWGLYAQAARHEWIKRREKMSEEKYQQYFDIFNPDLFDPAEWAKKAKDAGMKYAVITSKHHEGFNMFKSEYTDYNLMNTLYGKDIT